MLQVKLNHLNNDKIQAYILDTENNKALTIKQAIKSNEDLQEDKYFRMYTKTCLKTLLFSRQIDYNKLVRSNASARELLIWLDSNCIGISKRLDISSSSYYYGK